MLVLCTSSCLAQCSACDIHIIAQFVLLKSGFLLVLAYKETLFTGIIDPLFVSRQRILQFTIIAKQRGTIMKPNIFIRLITKQILYAAGERKHFSFR